MSQTIKIENAGPVESLTVPVQDKGGIVVIMGPNDSGKSESLKAYQKLLGGNEQIRKRYGTPRGVVEGLGVKLSLMANTRVSGECEAVSLEGELDIGELIDPGVKDPRRADALRIKALLKVRGVRANLARFLPLVGDDEHWLGELASDGTHAAIDLVDMAAGLKKDFEKESRSLADYAKTAEAGARAKRESAEGLDMDAVSNADILQGQWEAAIKHEATTTQTRVAQVTALNKRDTAKRNLAEAEAGYKGPTLVDAQAALNEADKAETDAGNAVEIAQRELNKAQSLLEATQSRCRKSMAQRDATAQHQQVMAGWAETIAAAADVEGVSDADMESATHAVLDARSAVEHGVRVRDAKKALAEAADLQIDADTLQKQADQLRDAAKGTNDVLADAVSVGTLIPVADDNGNFRFAVQSKNGDDRRTYYHDLGPGRRTMIAVTEAASCLRALDPDALKIALIVLPQGPWQDLDYANRCLVREHVRSLGVNLVAAQCDSEPSATGGIRAEVFEPTKCQEASG